MKKIFGISFGDNFFKLTFKGSLETQSPAAEFSPIKLTSPEWIIEYIETDKIFLNVRADGNVFSSTKGIVPFSTNYKGKKDKLEISQILKNKIQQYSQNSSFPSRQDVFKKIFVDKIFGVLTEKTQTNRQKLNQIFEKKYIDFLKAIIKETGEGFSKNRLLKKIPNNSMSALFEGGISPDSATKADELIALSLIDFTKEPSKEQKECKVEPHILDTELIKKIVKTLFDKECEEETTLPRFDGLSPRDTPIGKATSAGVILSFIRLYAIEYILRSLFIFDEFKFSENFIDDEIFIDYASSRIKDDLQKLELYEDFIKQLKKVYIKLKKEGFLKLKKQDIEEILSVSDEDNNIPFQLKILLKIQLEQVLKKITKIVGIDKNKEVNLKSVFFEGLNYYDTYSDFRSARR